MRTRRRIGVGLALATVALSAACYGYYPDDYAYVSYPGVAVGSYWGPGVYYPGPYAYRGYYGRPYAYGYHGGYYGRGAYIGRPYAGGYGYHGGYHGGGYHR
jgi:hypothetical protein